MTIAPLPIQDLVIAGQIVRLHTTAYQQEADLLGLPSLPGMERSAADIAELQEEFFGIHAAGTLIGAVSTAEEIPGRLCICSLTVLPEWQHQGLGRSLLRFVLAANPELELQVSTAAGNSRAIALYESEGFDVYRESVAPGLALKLVHLIRKRANPSVEPTNCGKPQSAAHLERWAP